MHRNDAKCNIDTILAGTLAADIEREPMTARAELPGLSRYMLLAKDHV